jgi:hypothetical protein
MTERGGFGATTWEMDAFLSLSDEEIARLVLWLLVEELLKERLAGFRAQELAPEPAERLEELGI